MDTRSKILTMAAALEGAPGPLTMVTGTFDVLHARHARELQAIRDRKPLPMLVAVLPLAGELLDQRGRAEMVAALRVVDYVVITGDADLDRLIAGLKPAQLVRLEDADALRTRQLIDHVHRRQTSQ